MSKTSLGVVEDMLPPKNTIFFALKVDFVQDVNFWGGNEVGRRYLTCSH